MGMPTLLYHKNGIYNDRDVYIDESRTGGLSIVWPKVSNIPRPLSLFTRSARLVTLPYINEIIGAIVEISADHKRSFPRR